MLEVFEFSESASVSGRVLFGVVDVCVGFGIVESSELPEDCSESDVVCGSSCWVGVDSSWVA